jgi:hypothetical protein
MLKITKRWTSIVAETGEMSKTMKIKKTIPSKSTLSTINTIYLKQKMNLGKDHNEILEFHTPSKLRLYKSFYTVDQLKEANENWNYSIPEIAFIGGEELAKCSNKCKKFSF